MQVVKDESCLFYLLPLPPSAQNSDGTE
jgi:hypothetical protein